MKRIHNPFSYGLTSDIAFSASQGFMGQKGLPCFDLRLAGKSRSKAQVLVDEEQARDSEVTHIAEQVGYLCLIPIDF